MDLKKIQPSVDYDYLLGNAKQFGIRNIPKEYISKDLIIDVISYNPLEYCNLDINYKIDKDIALHAVSLNGFVLLYVPQELQEDYDIVWAAVKANRDVINFIPDELQNKLELLDYVNNAANYDEFGEGISQTQSR